LRGLLDLRPNASTRRTDIPWRVLRLLVSFIHKSLTVVSVMAHGIFALGRSGTPASRWLPAGDPDHLAVANVGELADQTEIGVDQTLQECRVGNGGTTVKWRAAGEHPDGYRLGLAGAGHLRASLASGQGASLGLREE
jgi:hypothetical protein